jgi:hypothetical protein
MAFFVMIPYVPSKLTPINQLNRLEKELFDAAFCSTVPSVGLIGSKLS